MASVIEIEGIGPVYAARLEELGIRTVEQLLERGASPDGRLAIADETGISYPRVLRWVNMADLFRVGGIGEEYSDLLERAGVDTVPELAQRNPENLRETLAMVNEELHLVRQLPSLAEVTEWIGQAQNLPRVITYNDYPTGDAVTEIEGIGDAYGKKLSDAGAATVQELLAKGATPEGRAALIEATGIDHTRILRWVNNADLFRINGVASEYADLLEQSGVDTVPELRNRNPYNLSQRMAEINTIKNLVNRLPGLNEVTNWIEQARDLERVITY